MIKIQCMYVGARSKEASRGKLIAALRRDYIELIIDSSVRLIKRMIDRSSIIHFSYEARAADDN